MMMKKKKKKKDEENEIADDFYIYSPPEECSSLGDGSHVPEVYLAKSKNCILPKTGYHDDNVINKKNHTISVCDTLNGKNFILSFHVEAQDNVKCYVFFNGTIARFFPEDMLNVWPKFFKNSKQNEEFLKKKEELLQSLEKVEIRDDRFEEWYKMTTGKDDL
eukprot:45106_1